MKTKLLSQLLCLLFLTISMTGITLAQTDGGSTTRPQPPMAEKKPKVTNIHGETLVDNYFWLREKTNPAVLDYLKTEDAYTSAAMKPTEALQDKLYKEMLGHIKQTDVNVPYRQDGYFYYGRTEEGKQYQIFCRKKGSLEAKEEVIIDQNELAKERRWQPACIFNRQHRLSSVRFADQGSAHGRALSREDRARRQHDMGHR
jgi:protease II